MIRLIQHVQRVIIPLHAIHSHGIHIHNRVVHGGQGSPARPGGATVRIGIKEVDYGTCIESKVGGILIPLDAIHHARKGYRGIPLDFRAAIGGGIIIESTCLRPLGTAIALALKQEGDAESIHGGIIFRIGIIIGTNPSTVVLLVGVPKGTSHGTGGMANHLGDASVREGGAAILLGIVEVGLGVARVGIIRGGISGIVTADFFAVG
jgi:hypothetical protein